MNIRAILFVILIATPLPFSYGQSFQDYDGDFPESVKAYYHLKVPMRDGVELATDVYLPAEGGTYPTLMVRDIYSNGSSAVRLRYAKFATANGYAFVFQSSRGRYDSGGEWYPYFDEINDGDTPLALPGFYIGQAHISDILLFFCVAHSVLTSYHFMLTGDSTTSLCVIISPGHKPSQFKF